MVEIKIIKDGNLIKECYAQTCCVDYEEKKIEFFDVEYRRYDYESIDRGFRGSGMPSFNVTIKD